MRSSYLYNRYSYADKISYSISPKKIGHQQAHCFLQSLVHFLQYLFGYQWLWLTHKQLEMHGCVLSTVATDALVLNHQAISTQSADSIVIVLGQFYKGILQL